MSNIKLKDHNWSTAGIYDDDQAKYQSVINDELMTGKADKSATVSTVTYDSTNHKLTKTINGTTSDVMTVDTIPTDGSMNPITSDAAYDLKGAIKRNVFTVKGTLKSGVSSSGNIFTQSTASDSRITSNTEVSNVIFDSTVNITSATVVVTPSSGTVTITGTTSSFSGTVNIVVELYNT